MARAFGVERRRPEPPHRDPHLAPFLFTGCGSGSRSAGRSPCSPRSSRRRRASASRCALRSRCSRMDELLTWILMFFFFALFLEKVDPAAFRGRFFRWRKDVTTVRRRHGCHHTPTHRRRPDRQPPQSSSSCCAIVKSPTFARLCFPFVVLAFWLISIEILDAIWSFGTEVCRPRSKCGRSCGTRSPATPLARRTSTRRSPSRCKRLGIGFADLDGSRHGHRALAWGCPKRRCLLPRLGHGLLAMPALAWALFLSLVFGFGDTGPISP